MQYGVNEVFESIQGEATFTGTPSVFIRLQGCNLSCPFCDTKETWPMPRESPGVNEISWADLLEKKDPSPSYALIDGEELAARIVQSFRARHIVITGGEPCLYDLQPLCAFLAAHGYDVQLETSGAHEIYVPDFVWVTLSPKFGMPGSSGPLVNSLARADEIKMPVGKPADIERLQTLLHQIKTGVPVWLQPLSQSEKATQLCIEAATQFGWKLSLQTHKFIGVR